MPTLSGLDSAFLALETPRQPLHAALAAVVDTSAMPEPYSFDTVREWAKDEVGRRPLFRRRVVEVPLGLDHPRWVDESGVDLDAHLTRLTLPGGAGLAGLWRLAGDFLGRPLERGRPLWEAWVIEGLGPHRVGVLCKVHHAVVDGVSAAQVLAELVDDRPDLEDTAHHPRRGRAAGRLPSGPELLGSGVASLLCLPGQLARALPPTVAAVSRLDHGADASQSMAAPFRAPRTPFNGALTSRRLVATATLRLGDLRRAGRACGASMNDVVLAVCSGAIRRHLQRHGGLPSAPLVCLVPVSTRDRSDLDDEVPATANRLSALLVPLPTDQADPASRLRAVAAATRAAKAGHAVLGPGTLMAWAEVGRPVLWWGASRLYSWLGLPERLPPVCNLVVSNVAGPRKALSFRGARASALYPLGPLLEGVSLNVTVFSHAGRVDVGLVACPDLLPDLAGLAGELAPALGELGGL